METRMNSARSNLQWTEARLASIRSKLEAAQRLDPRAKHDLANALCLVISCREILLEEQPEAELIDEAEAALKRAMEIAYCVEAG